MNLKSVQELQTLEPKQFHRRLEAIFENLNTSGRNEWLTQLFLSAFRSYLADDLFICSIHVYDVTCDPAEHLSSWGKPVPSVQSLFRERKEETFPWFIDQRGSYCVVFPFGEEHNLLIALFCSDVVDQDLFRIHLAGYFSSLHYALVQHFRRLKLQDALEEAREIQLSLLPTEPAKFRGFDIAALTVPARTVGGDVYDFFKVTEESVMILIADAAGHGLPAALQARDVITGLRMGIEERVSLPHVIEKLNRVIHRSGVVSRFISVFVGELHSDGTLFYVNAGHPSPIWKRDSQFKTLDAGGMILGPHADQSYRIGHIQMQPGDSLLLYTDGILEHTSSDEVEFGIDRLKEWMQTCSQYSSEQCTENLFQTIHEYGGGKALVDDATMLLVKRT